MYRRNTASRIEWIRLALLAECVLFGSMGQGLQAAEPQIKAKGKQLPAYVTSKFEKPRVRSVHTNKAVVRSGPADQNYSTQSLSKGQVVDVYMETSDGWSAVRPPAGSHDWIPAHVAYLLPGGKTAEVIEEETPCWIGSDSKDVSEFRWVTSLKKSQLVQILGEENQSTDDGKKQLWFRIAPPQGEFRWVRTSQLSDTITPPDLKATPVDHAVQQASFLEKTSESSNDQTEVPEGKIVWSNEREVLAQVDRQIKSEQAEVKQRLAADGVSLDGVTSNGGAEESIAVDGFVDSQSVNGQRSTHLRPIPMASTKKQKGAEHQTDSIRQWDAMQNSGNPKLRVGPLSNILGLVGISVVEAERAPPNAGIAQSYQANANQNNLGQIGPVGSSRMDRLPRPGRRTGGMTIPPDETVLHETQGTIHAPSNEFKGLGSAASVYPPSHYSSGESTFSRWMNSREPIFGGAQSTQAGAPGMPVGQYAGPTTQPQFPFLNNPSSMNAVGTAPAYSNAPTMANVSSTRIPQDNSAWHGFPPSLREAPIPSDVSVIEPRIGKASPATEEFQTPEIQSALVSLTQEVASPTEEWDLTPLRRQASNWIENGATAMVRGEARLLMERIERFESLRMRTLGMVQNTSQLAQNTLQQAGSAYLSQYTNNRNDNPVVPASAVEPSTQPNAHSAGASTVQVGDASGWLVQVHSSIPGQPEFALTDDAGNVVTYVQSTAALNLRRYLQQPVKIYGVRGYLPNLASKQILAERVQRLR
ncbi:MAG: hypothetical protein ABL921_04405 [Pirellula sp.]